MASVGGPASSSSPVFASPSRGAYTPTGRRWQPQVAATRVLGDLGMAFLVAGYIAIATMLSIVNKWAISLFPFAGTLTAMQFGTSAAGVALLGVAGFITVDKLEAKKMWLFLPAAGVFYLALYANSQLLVHANVDTVIVFRSAVPLFVAVGDSLILNSRWPRPAAWAALCLILTGAAAYVYIEQNFSLTTYGWAVFYIMMMSVDALGVKHIVNVTGLSTWGLVLYNNLEALMLYPFIFITTGEASSLLTDNLLGRLQHINVLIPVLLSCVLGLAMSFFGLGCRRSTSATAFTVLGITNKLLTVVVNFTIWSKHASLKGTMALCLCLAGGVLYQQASKRSPVLTSATPKGGGGKALLSSGVSPKEEMPAAPAVDAAAQPLMETKDSA